MSMRSFFYFLENVQKAKHIVVFFQYFFQKSQNRQQPRGVHSATSDPDWSEQRKELLPKEKRFLDQERNAI